jgi:hypothetical protein
LVAGVFSPNDSFFGVARLAKSLEDIFMALMGLGEYSGDADANSSSESES